MCPAGRPEAAAAQWSDDNNVTAGVSPVPPQIGLMSVTVFPVRLLLVASLMLLAWPFAFVASLGRSDFVVEPPSWWMRCVCFCLVRAKPMCEKGQHPVNGTNEPFENHRLVLLASVENSIPSLCIRRPCVLRQRHRPVSTCDHAGHVVLRRVPLDQSERPAGGAHRSSHPRRGAALLLLRRHPGDLDHVLHSRQTGEQEHSRLGQ